MVREALELSGINNCIHSPVSEVLHPAMAKVVRCQTLYFEMQPQFINNPLHGSGRNRCAECAIVMT
jgi:hypothetical protein